MPDASSFISRHQATRPFFIGIDLGGTNIKVGLVDDEGRTLAWTQIPTQADLGPEEGARRMAHAAHGLIAEAGLDPQDVAHVGLGSPGTMDVPAGMLLEPHNLPGWFNFPIRDRVKHHCGLPVAFSNDANAAAYGEYWIGAGREFTSMVLFTLGTGIGCGVIVGDLLLEGEHSHGAECGHLIISFEPDARVCPCGRTGHLEGYASATAVVKRTEERLAAGACSTLTERIASGEAFSPKMLAEEAERGDEFSLEMILETARYLGVGAVNLMHTIDPDGVVLGGAMTFGGHENPVGRRFLAEVRAEIHRRAFPVLSAATVVDFASLGPDAGYIGAAGVARLAHQRKRP